ncbi:hypothetical protein GQ53DRAFT_686097, partial [Thozetella sp. PMI_491]
MPFARPASATARKMMKDAFEDLNGTITAHDSREFHSKTLQDVQQAALDIERQLAARQCLRNTRRLLPLIKGLENYSQVVGILCNGTPFLPWIWAPITLILGIASEYVRAFELIMKGYDRVASSLNRLDLLSNAFANSPEFQQTLAVFYADILQFHKHAYMFVRRSGWRLLFLTSWGRFQRRFDSLIEDMEHHETLIDREASARSAVEIQKMCDKISAWREENTEKLALLEREMSAKQFLSAIAWIKGDQSDQFAVFDSISSEASKYIGTGSWLLQHTKIKSWLQRKPDPPVLWLQGNPGSGKSIICAQLINYMKIAEGQFYVIYHFCTYLHASSTSYDGILKSLILQLLQKDGDLITHVYSEYVLGKKSPTIPVLEQLLRFLLSSISSGPCQLQYVWIVLDGLNECETDTQVRIMGIMNQVLAKTSASSPTACKLLVSNRYSQNFSKRMRRNQVVSLAEEKSSVEEAIREYTSQRLHLLHHKLSQHNLTMAHLMCCLNTSDANSPNGMFLYARLVVDYLASNIFYSAEEVKTSVHQLPQKLSDLLTNLACSYRKILARILKDLDERSVDRVSCILGWVAFAKRPLKRLELLSALTFSLGDPKVTQIAPSFGMDRALKEHGIATITCLIATLEFFHEGNHEERNQLRIINGLYGLCVYAAEYWVDYLLSAVKLSDGSVMLSSLLAIANQLATQLSESFHSKTQSLIIAIPELPDERVELLKEDAILHKHVIIALGARSVKQLESRLNQKGELKGKKFIDGISETLNSYQECLVTLLSQHDFPGVSADDFEFFKSQVRSTAFTCRLSSCPRATVGFESSNLRLEHEINHVRRFSCTFPGCQYPPFLSATLLKSHAKRCHDSNVPRRGIRRVGT